MQSRKIGGNIAVISSDAGRVPYPGLSVFCGTKFFVEGFLRSLRLESKPNDIVITSIQPGDVQTPSQQWTTDTEVWDYFIDFDTVFVLIDWFHLLGCSTFLPTALPAWTMPEGLGFNA